MGIIDITKTPFSRYGSYLAITSEEGRDDCQIYNAMKRFQKSLSADIRFYYNGNRVKPLFDAQPECLKAIFPQGTVTFVISEYGIYIQSNGIDLEICQISGDGYGKFMRHHVFQMISVEQNQYLSLKLFQGNGTICDTKGQNLMLSCDPEGELSAIFNISLQEDAFLEDLPDWKEALHKNQMDWEKFKENKSDCIPGSFQELTWYNVWSCFVHAEDVYKNDLMVMSKKMMCGVWSWDHCFNALALLPFDPQSALNQFLAPFHLQAPSGALPDLWSPYGETIWCISKPPIHGWCFSKMMDEISYPSEVLADVYGKLEKLTGWWMTYRDSDNDGIPEYPQGCDCGWDNATLFDDGYFKESPDLPAFLVLQMKCLERIAGKLEWSDKAQMWKERAAKLLAAFYDHSWAEDRFVTFGGSDHHAYTDSFCLLNLMPLVLGEHLDEEKRKALTERLKANHLTSYGLASESPQSPKYESNGYWRGPIWAPTTYLIVDGLYRGGEKELASDISRRYLNMTENIAGGHYENFDALTGKGLCSTGYTWSASVYLLLKNDMKEKA